MESASASSNPDFVPRDYQIEIFEEACKGNVIACLGTGTGKTFIAVMLIKELANEIKGTMKENGKRTFFLVTTVPLVYQQSKVIEDRTGFKVGKYTGEMNVDAWDNDAWENEFNKHDVLVMTHQILLNNLLHGFIKPSNINLLILDECHHTSKSHPYMRIMKEIEGSVQRPRVMGLTASIINEKAKKRGFLLRSYLEQRMKELEANLRAVCFTCADQSATLPYAAKPKESIRTFQPLSSDKELEIKILTGLMEEALATPIQRPTDRASKQAYEKCTSILKDLNEILSTLGTWCTYKAALEFKKNLGFTDDATYHSILKGIVNTITSSFEMYAKDSFGSVECVLMMEPLIAPKIYALMDLLVENKKERDLCGIVFVRRRVTAKVLSELINRLVGEYDHYSGILCDFVHGHSQLELMRGSDHGGMTSKKQEQILRRFREGEFNVLIATSVVEEGLDVRKCNLVVRFDGLDNYREYVQSKGRARAAESRYVVLAEQSKDQDVNSNIKAMREVEKFLLEKCRGREPPSEAEILALQYNDVLIEPFQINGEEGAAQISQDNAVQLLYMYCARLPSDRCTNLAPSFRYSKVDGDPVALVTLPLNSPVREEIQGDPMPFKKFARISAAQKACIRLYELGELDDHFVPISYSDSSEDEDDDDNDDDNDQKSKPGTKKARHVYERKIPNCFKVDGAFPTTGLYLYKLEIVLSKPKETEQACLLWKFWYQEDRHIFGLLTAKSLPKVPCFPLFTKSGEVQVNVKLLKSDIYLEESKLKKAARFHKHIMQNYIEKIEPECEFSWADASSKAILVAVEDRAASIEIKKRKKEHLIDFEFMQKLCAGSQNTPIAADYEDAVIKKTYADTGSLFYVTAVRDDIQVTDKIASGKPSFKDYYKSKYGKDIASGQPLLESVQASSRGNLISPRAFDDKEKSLKRPTESVMSRSGTVHLVPELCIKLSMPASFHCQSVCMPALLFRLETMLVAEGLRRRMINGINQGDSDEQYFDAVDIEQHPGAFYDNFASRDSFSDRIAAPKNAKKQSRGAFNAAINTDLMYQKMQAFLQGKSQGSNSFIKPQVILQSLTTSKANAGFDLERLETLGDSFLKVATTIHLYFNHPNKNEGKLTQKRTRFISNKNLLTVATQKRIQENVCNTAFGLKRSGNKEDSYSLWIPPMYIKEMEQEDESSAKACQIIRDKSVADCVEALIGAFFEHGGIEQALKIMKWFGITCFYKDSETQGNNSSCRSRSKYADFPNPVTALFRQNPDTLRFVNEQYEKSRFSSLESRLQYTFKEKSFLIQAFTHMSYYKNRATDCYQRLEFLGDALLDFLIIAHLYACDNELDPSSLTNIKSALVNNNTFAMLAVKYKLHKYLMYFDQKLHSALGQFTNLDEEEIKDQLKNPFIITFGDNDDEGFHAPKLLGDIFESLAGAIFLDSGLDLVQVWRVFYPIMQPLIDQYMEDVPLNPVRELHELSPTASSRCKKMENGKIKCTWNVDGNEFEGTGQNGSMAKASAALKALSQLKISN